jgi:hypothetical protein
MKLLGFYTINKIDVTIKAFAKKQQKSQAYTQDFNAILHLNFYDKATLTWSAAS